MNFKHSILGSALAFILATSCCWLPALIIALGGGSALMGFANGLESYSLVFILIGAALLAFGIYRYYKRKALSVNGEVNLNSTITCPECGFAKEEDMPTDSCQYFYECEHCKKVLKPIKNDCCVYCSYGTVACPPIQLNENCC